MSWTGRFGTVVADSGVAVTHLDGAAVLELDHTLDVLVERVQRSSKCALRAAEFEVAQPHGAWEPHESSCGCADPWLRE